MNAAQLREGAPLSAPGDASIAFYERFPFPGPCPADEAASLDDLANGVRMLLPAARLQDARIADIGCGTGQRLIALARKCPTARFVGVDPAAAAIEQARAAAREAGIANIEWRVDRLDDVAPDGAGFDVVIASGLVHHLDDPKAGLHALARLLAPEGLLYAWLYHALGEFERLRRRELARVFCPEPGDAARMAEVADALGLGLAPDHYGPGSVRTADAAQPSRAVVDAYFHPVVAAFRFGELPRLLAGSGLDWYGINSVNTPGRSYLLDTGEAGGVAGLFAPRLDTLLGSTALGRRYRELPLEERLRVTELVLRPTGFTLLAGRTAALASLGERVRRAACPIPEAAR